MNWMSMFYQGYEPLVRIILLGALGYVGLIFLLRVAGKRTLSKLNAFDMVVTFAFGSTFATLILSKDTSLASGVMAFAVLVTLQFAVAWGSTRLAFFRQLVKSEPRVLVYRGEFREEAMQAERLPKEEILAVLRKQGVRSLDEVEAVVLETDGEFSIIRRTDDDQIALTLRGVDGIPSGAIDIPAP